jgi:hypothetical protein
VWRGEHFGAISCDDSAEIDPRVNGYGEGDGVQKKMMTKGGYVEDTTRFMDLYVNERKLQFNNLKTPQLQLSVTTQFNEHTIFTPFYASIKKLDFPLFSW